jgi:hypothetical protein
MSIRQSTEVWCLLIDHQRQPAFGRAFSVMVPSDDYPSFVDKDLISTKQVR